MKLLIALDATDAAETLTDEVAARPWPAGTEARVLHVADLFTFPAGTPVVGADADAAAHPVEPLLKSAAERLTARGLAASTEVIEGYPPSQIVEYADHWGADFVIVGAHNDGELTRFLLGSVAQEVVRRAACSVAIIRPCAREAGRPGLRVLLATDGSESSLEAARSVATRPWPEGSEVRVVSVAATVLPAWQKAPDLINRQRAEAVKQAEEYVVAAREVLAATGMTVTGATLTGRPKACIVDEAREWGADLVVVGSHGKRGMSRLFIGGVSEAVAMHAPCSVEVIRQRAR